MLSKHILTTVLFINTVQLSLVTLLFLNYLPVRVNASVFQLKSDLRISQNCRNHKKNFQSKIREE